MNYVLPAVSTAFRIASYIFLQIIPTTLARPVLPTLYILYISAFFLPAQVKPARAVRDDKPNGDAKPLPPPPTKSYDPISTLCFSLQTNSRILKWSNFAINTLLFLAALDLAFTPFFDPAHDVAFTRVGAVYPDSVKIQVRRPSNESLLVLYREAVPVASDTLSEWKSGPQVHPLETSDWVDTVRVSGLWPNTKYEYVVADSDKTILDVSTKPVTFTTFPDPRLSSGSHFRFVASSCITPNFPYRGPWNKRSIRGFDLLADYLTQISPGPLGKEPVNLTTANDTLVLPQTPSIDFLLFLGDFIYADVPVYIGDDKSAYQRLYRRNYASPSFRKVYEQLPIIHAYDDHEFINNYVGNAQEIPPYVNASAAYNSYAGNANHDAARVGQTFYNFQHGDIAFFVLDTRRYRTPTNVSEEDDTPSMLGQEQLVALHNWLQVVNGTKTFKFIVSSVPFTSLWTHDAQIDSWAAYPAEKASLLKVLHSVPNVVVISGDRHEFAVIEFNPPDSTFGHVVREISTSPLSMFYVPFIHTLRPQSNETVSKVVLISEEETEQVQIPLEQTISYIPVGNFKWSTFELDTRDSQKPILRVETVIDGKPSSHLEFIGAPSRPSVTSLGSLVTTNFKDLFNKIGIDPGRWF
ncbi:PhoD-like phosphatase-domain-containing protein [Crepidotus variabilis]|uniref:PhoD-like phosphatase-domain-containing protein n=1 Tax=Crepidotus variabilis TaxID=179855 RepID=A0A9P6JSX1_9AGAR|nr:PhoD-like phosphatase-domain-containing protein [Crepidotus variabilis]